MPPPSTPLPPAFNFAAHVLHLNAARGSKAAYIDDTGTLSYADLATRVRNTAGALRAHGLRREERVLLCLQDTVDFPAAFLGALYAGIVPVPVNTLLPVGDIAYMLAHCRARAVVVSHALLPLIERAMAAGPHEVDTVWVSAPGTPAPAGSHDFAACITHAPLAEPATTGPDEMAFWLYSSGSTGRPKGTVHTHGNLVRTAELYGTPVLGIRDDDVMFSAAKLFFAYGLGNALTFPLTAGATTILMAERPTPAAVCKRLREHRPTLFCGVPTLYAALLASPDLPARDAVSLRRCISAGEALPREVGEKVAAHFGCDVLDGIGSTEMLHIFLSNRAGSVRYGTTGLPVPGYDVELRSEAGHAVADGEIGDLWTSGPSAALMYWGNRAQSLATFQGPWTKTGDKYTRDADGYYVYAGRGDDMMKVSGQYVSPFEVETTLMRHEAVLEAAVVGRPDRDGLMRTLAFVVTKPGVTADDALADALKAFAKQQLAPHKYPRDVRFIAELPKTATGKIQRFKLRDGSVG